MSQETADSCLQTCGVSPLMGWSPSVTGSQSKKNLSVLGVLGPEDGIITILRNIDNHLHSGKRHIVVKWNSQQHRCPQFKPRVSKMCCRWRPLDLPVTAGWRKHENLGN
jgi:hypothetical protein